MAVPEGDRGIGRRQGLLGVRNRGIHTSCAKAIPGDLASRLEHRQATRTVGQQGELGWLSPIEQHCGDTNVLTAPIYTDGRGKVVEVVASQRLAREWRPGSGSLARRANRRRRRFS
jgi:hypothetical protein